MKRLIKTYSIKATIITCLIFLSANAFSEVKDGWQEYNYDYQLLGSSYSGNSNSEYGALLPSLKTYQGMFEDRGDFFRAINADFDPNDPSTWGGGIESGGVERVPVGNAVGTIVILVFIYAFFIMRKERKARAS